MVSRRHAHGKRQTYVALDVMCTAVLQGYSPSEMHMQIIYCGIACIFQGRNLTTIKTVNSSHPRDHRGGLFREVATVLTTLYRMQILQWKRYSLGLCRKVAAIQRLLLEQVWL